MSFPKSHEDNLLFEYWKVNRGSIFLEVPIGNGRDIWPKGSKTRGIDGIRVLDNNDKIYIPYDSALFKEAVKYNEIELIEAKRKLNRMVYGQVIAGMDMLKKQYKAKSVKGVIVCEKGDPAIELICEERGIKVAVI